MSSNAWIVMPATALDTLTLLAAAAMKTERITLGTSIVPAFTRHPLAFVTQALALEGLAPGRFDLGIGTAHARTMVDVYHVDFDHPLRRLIEYLQHRAAGAEDRLRSFRGRVLPGGRQFPARARHAGADRRAAGPRFPAGGAPGRRRHELELSRPPTCSRSPCPPCRRAPTAPAGTGRG